MFNQFQINRIPIILTIKSSIFLFLCIQSMLSFTDAKSKDSEDGSKIIVLGADGQLTASHYVPRKSGKGSGTIIIVGPGSGPGINQNNNDQYNNKNQHHNHFNHNPNQGANVLQQGPTWSMPNLSPTHQQYSSSSIIASSSNIPEQVVPIGSANFPHNPSVLNNPNHYQSSIFDDWSVATSPHKIDNRNCAHGGDCGQMASSLPQLVPIMVPYVKPRKRLSISRSPSIKGNKAQESRINYQKTTLQQVPVNSQEPQIIIRKAKNSPPILIEEAKFSNDGYVDFHVTSQNNNAATQSMEQISVGHNLANKHNSNQESQPMYLSTNSNSGSISQVKIGDDNDRLVNSHSGVELANGFSTVTQKSPMNMVPVQTSSMSPLQAFNLMNQLQKIGSISPMQSVDSINSKINQLNQMNQLNKMSAVDGINQIIKNGNTPALSTEYIRTPEMSKSHDMTLAELTVSPYNYDSSTTTPVNPENSLNHGYGTKEMKDGPEGYEVYDEKVFNQFYGFDQVPTVDLSDLPEETHLPNIIINNEDDGSEGGRRIDENDELDNLDDISSYNPRQGGLKSLLRPKEMKHQGPVLPLRWNKEYIPKWNENEKTEKKWPHNDKSKGNGPFSWWWPWVKN